MNTYLLNDLLAILMRTRVRIFLTVLIRTLVRIFFTVLRLGGRVWDRDSPARIVSHSWQVGGPG